MGSVVVVRVSSSGEQDTVDEIKITASTVNKFFILCFSYFFQGMFLKSINLIPQFQRHSFYVKYSQNTAIFQRIPHLKKVI